MEEEQFQRLVSKINTHGKFAAYCRQVCEYLGITEEEQQGDNPEWTFACDDGDPIEAAAGYMKQVCFYGIP